MVITSEQVRAARALLRWDERDLSEAAKLPLSLVARLEAHPGLLAAEPSAIEALRAAFAAAGLDFIEENGGGAGVRLRKPGGEGLAPEELNASNDE
jgi:hypothetical protein